MNSVTDQMRLIEIEINRWNPPKSAKSDYIFSRLIRDCVCNCFHWFWMNVESSLLWGYAITLQRTNHSKHVWFSIKINICCHIFSSTIISYCAQPIGYLSISSIRKWHIWSLDVTHRVQCTAFRWFSKF